MEIQTSDIRVLIQFAKDQGWDLIDVMESVERLEKAIAETLGEEDGTKRIPDKG